MSFEEWFAEWKDNYGSNYNELQAAYNAGVADERERCAGIADGEASEWCAHSETTCFDEEDKMMAIAREDALLELAAAIRRGDG